jgi:hypothetical protein
MASQPVIRIPNLPIGQVVNDQGHATDDELTFRHTLITSLQNNFGNEGCVVPTQANDAAPNDFIRQIQDNQQSNGQFTCGFGRFLYDATNKRILVSIDDGTGTPKFMEVTLAAPVPPV